MGSLKQVMLFCVVKLSYKIVDSDWAQNIWKDQNMYDPLNHEITQQHVMKLGKR